MKIAVLADIHANYPALLEVAAHVERWQPDRVLIAGDIVNRGPRPRQVLEFVRQKQETEGWQVIRGNHEDYVLFHTRPDSPLNGPLFDIFQYSYWTYRQLGEDNDYLNALPEEYHELIGGGEFRGVHASMRDNRSGIYPEMSDRAIARLIAPPPVVIAVGHTHRPLVRQIGDCLVINAGSVGLPFDADPRAAYAQITFHHNRWQAKIIRLKYDIAQTERDFHESGFLAEAGPLAEVILLELRVALSQLYCWTNTYFDAVLHEEISVEESVRQYMQHPITRPYWQLPGDQSA